MAKLMDPLILPADVRLIPVQQLPEPTRSQFNYSPGDVALTRIRSRAPSKIISADLAALLEQFSSPRTMVEAILYHSLRHAVEPRELLEDAFPFIEQLVGSELLVAASQASAATQTTHLHRGDCVDNFTITRPLRLLTDTELYQARDEMGTLVALKLVKPQENPLIGHALQHEARVLRHLNGVGTPRCIQQGTIEEQPYLAVEWCPGVDAAVAAAELRESGTAPDRRQLLALCVSILAAYTKLHDRQTVHGDVHPHNILVDSNDDVYLIDFGLSRILQESVASDEPYRGGIAFFLEPEYCAACLANWKPPRANPLGEQYALAALIYHLLTGAHYLDFSLEQDVLWQQIVDHSPLPFTHHQIAAWPEVEEILAKALQKDPRQRFTDVAEFCQQLSLVITNQRPWERDGSRQTKFGSAPIRPHSYLFKATAAELLLSNVLERLRWQGSLLAEGLPRSPTASVTYGAAGVATFLYRVACVRSDPELLVLADLWATKTEAQIADEAGFYNSDIDITPATVGRVSPYHTPSGLSVVRFSLAQAMGDAASQATALTTFIDQAGQDCEAVDLTLGKSGVLLNSALLYEALPDKKWAQQSGLLPFGNRLLNQIWEEVGPYKALEWGSELSNLGIAHGWAGILYATLHWCDLTGTAVPTNVESRLQQVANCAESVGRGVEWPWDLSHSEPIYMPGWCNGSAGHVFLWSTAYRFYKQATYLDLAIRAGWNAWESPAPATSLCCGLAGRGYALLHLYKLTDDDAWLDRARQLGQRASNNLRQSPPKEYEGFENSLYKGELGVAVLLVDLDAPILSAMPLFERTGSQTSNLA
jgi:serine/threonine protein kinase